MLAFASFPFILLYNTIIICHLFKQSIMIIYIFYVPMFNTIERVYHMFMFDIEIKSMKIEYVLSECERCAEGTLRKKTLAATLLLLYSIMINNGRQGIQDCICSHRIASHSIVKFTMKTMYIHGELLLTRFRLPFSAFLSGLLNNAKTNTAI